MIKTKKQMFIIIGLFTLLLFLGGTAYAWFTYRAESGTSELIAGDIYLVMEEGNEEIELSNIFPETAEEARARNDNFITFDISGLNDSSKAIYYEIVLDHGTEKSSPKTRYRDQDLKFDLIEIGTNNEETYLLSAVDYDSLVNQRIYVNTIPASSSSEVSKHYKLRMWLSEDVTISDTDPNATYNTTEYRNKYASVKVVVKGDLIEKTADNPGSAPISLSASSGTIAPGSSKTVTITTTGDGVLSCQSSNTSIATCSISGTTLTINGITNGNATITVNQAVSTGYLRAGSVLYYVTEIPAAHTIIENVISSKNDVTTDADAEGVVFLKGTEETINFNYVWYSGKLWRIVAIYPNGEMKLITENNMTGMHWGPTANDVAFNNSYVDQWLSQEFLPTLYNYENIVHQNAEWNVTGTNDVSVDLYQIDNYETINRTVGLLNTYEYTQTRPISAASYLYVDQWGWIMNPKLYNNNPGPCMINLSGNLERNSAYEGSAGIRPAIILQSSVRFIEGDFDGTRAKPYRIQGDIEIASSNDYVNTRISGEYVSIGGELYRIVGIDESKTKIVKTDYISNPNYTDWYDNRYAHFSLDPFYNTNSNNLIYWDSYLTDTTDNGWLSNINTNLLENGVFYSGPYKDGASYKATICSSYDSSTSTSSCAKLSGTYDTYTGLVGLLRVGEMHAAQQSTTVHVNSNNNSYLPMWLITPYFNGGTYVDVYNMSGGGCTSKNYTSSSYRNANFAARPSMFLKSSVKITSGSGTIFDPYVVGL